MCCTYPNGYVDLFKSFDFDLSSATKTWNGRAVEVPSIDYPFTFEDIPCVTMFIGNTNTQQDWIDAVIVPSGGLGSSVDLCKGTGLLKIISQDSSIKNTKCRISIRAFGKVS